MLRQLIRRLRAKISEACQETPAEYIETVAGLGYGLVIHRRPEKRPKTDPRLPGRQRLSQLYHSFITTPITLIS